MTRTRSEPHGNRTILRRSLTIIGVLALLLSSLSGLIGSAPAAAQETQVPYGDVIVVMQDGLDPSAFATTSLLGPWGGAMR